MHAALQFTDRFLMAFYRITGNPAADYFIGTFVLSFITVVLGEGLIAIAFRANRHFIARLNNALATGHETSLRALREGDRAYYRALNKEANETFGKVFFHMTALSAAYLAPVFFALSWMQMRFLHVEFSLPVTVPIFGDSVGYVFTFALMYIASRILVRRIKRSRVKRVAETQRA